MHECRLLVVLGCCLGAFLVGSDAFWSDSIDLVVCQNPCVTQCALPGGWSQPPFSDTHRHWQRRESETPTPGTGAKYEHTGTGDSRYLHLESGSTTSCGEQLAGDRFTIMAPQIDLSPYANIPNGENLYFTFWLWMYGTSVGALNVSVNSNGGPFRIMTQLQGSSRINNWQVMTINLRRFRGTTIRVRFSGKTMEAIRLANNLTVPFVWGDIDIDDLEAYYTGDIQPVSGSELSATWFALSQRYPKSLDLAPFQSSHVAGYINGTIRTWGGLDSNNALVDRVHEYNVEQRAYSTVYLDDDDDEKYSARKLFNAPLPRHRAAVAYLPDRMLIYGGNNYKGPVDDTEAMVSYSLLTGNFTVLSCTTNDQPQAPNHLNFVAEGASAVVDDFGDIWLYGGRTTAVQLNFVTKVTLSPCIFSNVSLQAGPPIPRSRWGHIATFTNIEGNRRLWIFGGRFQPSQDDVPEVLGDLQVFDIDQSKWCDVIVHDRTKAPSPRSFAAGAQNMAGDKWIIYGGLDDSIPSNPIAYKDVYMLYFHEKYAIWRKLDVGGDSIPRRAGHAMVPVHIPSENREAFYILGGFDKDLTTYNTVEKLAFGEFDDETPLPKEKTDDGGNNDDVVILAVVLTVVFGLCLFLMLALLIGSVIGLYVWKAQKTKALRRKYGIDNASETELEELARDCETS